MARNANQVRVPFTTGQKAVTATFTIQGAADISGVPVASPAIAECGAHVHVIYARIRFAGGPNVMSNYRLDVDVHLDSPASKDGDVAVNVYLRGASGFACESVTAA